MLNVNVLYNAQEFFFEIDKGNTFGYETLCENIKTKLELNDKEGILKLMTINTQERFVFLIESNYSNIINENFPENTLKLCASMIIEKSVTDIINQDKQNNINYEDISGDEDDDFLTNEITDNKTKTNNNKLNQNTNTEKIISYIDNSSEEEDEQENKKTQIKSNDNNDNAININQSSSKVDKTNENNNENIIKEISFPVKKKDNEKNKVKSNNDNSDINNNDKDKNISLFDNENIDIQSQKPSFLIKNTTSFAKETCDICKNPLQNIKYICLICDSLTICTFCERDHPHSVIKYKTHFLSYLSQTYSFIKSKQPSIKGGKSFINDLFNEKDISIENGFDSFISMRPNTEVQIPIIIHNNSKAILCSREFTLIVKNYKHINMFFNFPKNYFIINPGKSLLVHLVCQSKFECTQEKVCVELYSKELKIKHTSKASFRLTINVNEDVEDERLSKIFNAYPKVKVLKKEYKSIILTMMNDNLTTKGPNEIYEILKKYKWNVDIAFDSLNKK